MYSEQIPGASLSLCMLSADPSAIRSRFLQRGWSPHLVGEAIREATALKLAKFADLRVDTDGNSASTATAGT
jgi:hypothetical protein